MPRPASSVSYAHRRGSGGSNSSGSSTPIPASSVSSKPVSKGTKTSSTPKKSSIFGDVDVEKLGGNSLFGNTRKGSRGFHNYEADEDIFTADSRRRPVFQERERGSPGTSRPSSLFSSDEEHPPFQKDSAPSPFHTETRRGPDITAPIPSKPEDHKIAREDMRDFGISPRSGSPSTNINAAKTVGGAEVVSELSRGAKVQNTKPQSPKQAQEQLLSSNLSPSVSANVTKAPSPKPAAKQSKSSIFSSVAPFLSRPQSREPSPVAADTTETEKPVSTTKAQQTSTTPAAPAIAQSIVNESSRAETRMKDQVPSPVEPFHVENEVMSHRAMIDEDPESIAFRNDMSFSIKPVVPNINYIDPNEDFLPPPDITHNTLIQHTATTGPTDIDDPWQSSIIPPPTSALSKPILNTGPPDLDYTAFQPMESQSKTQENLMINTATISENKRNAFSDLISNWNSGSVGQMEFITDPAFVQDDSEFYQTVAKEQSDVGFKGIEDEAEQPSGHGYSIHHTLMDGLGGMNLNDNPWS
ncbi:hypothetical protein INT43_006510 [Umbelopsis isabellina]|uniref:Uncharacterized protein n=1 Tax=Mortierella isabellina TaxID=91625 RepID=A0A8H7ULT1_MORIS|nr:hypothetical protein INT43_006510 [Umbelopsis isabellina]